MKRLPDNVHGGGTDSAYETEQFGTSVDKFDAVKVAAHLEAAGFGNFKTEPMVGGVSAYKPYNSQGKYCVRVNYYDARALTGTEMSNLEAAIKATPEG